MFAGSVGNYDCRFCGFLPLKRAIKGWSKMSFYSQDLIRIKLLGDNNGSANRPAYCSANGDCSSSAADPQHISTPLALPGGSCDSANILCLRDNHRAGFEGKDDNLFTNRITSMDLASKYDITVSVRLVWLSPPTAIFIAIYLQDDVRLSSTEKLAKGSHRLFCGGHIIRKGHCLDRQKAVESDAIDNFGKV